jgi:hypothetical protein
VPTTTSARTRHKHRGHAPENASPTGLSGLVDYINDAPLTAPKNQALDASVADAVLDRVEDHVAAQTYRLGALDERGEPRSLRPATPPVQQHGSLVAGEVGRRDNLGIGVDGSPVRRSAGMVTDESGLAAVVSGIV